MDNRLPLGSRERGKTKMLVSKKQESTPNEKEQLATLKKVTLSFDIAPNMYGYLSALARLLKYPTLDDYLIDVLVDTLNRNIEDYEHFHKQMDAALTAWNIEPTAKKTKIEENL